MKAINQTFMLVGHCEPPNQNFWSGVFKENRMVELNLKFEIDSPFDPNVAELLDRHLELMRSISPPESVHALDHSELCSESVTLWSVWQNCQLCGCCALKEHPSKLGELKSMHILQKFRGQGIGCQVMKHVIGIAKSRNYTRLCLETGAEDEFAASRKLYLKHGFEICLPFADYVEDPHSVFMELKLNKKH